MVRQDTICTCDICGKQMFASETGHNRYQTYLELGSNIDPQFIKRYDDVCDECTTAIQNTIAKRQDTCHCYYSNIGNGTKLRETNK